MVTVTASLINPKIEFELKLIDEIKKRPCLYSEVNKGREHNSIKTKAWNEIYCKLGQSVEICKRKWNNLKSNFRKHRINAQIRKCEDVTWVHYETIKSFLEVPKIVNNDETKIENNRENMVEKSIEIELMHEQKLQDIYNKCGEIMISSNKKFKFVCWICHEEHDTIEAFSSHILKIHLEFNKNLIEFQNKLSDFVQTNCNTKNIQSNEQNLLTNNGIAIIKKEKINDCGAKKIYCNNESFLKNKETTIKTENDMLHEIFGKNQKFNNDKQSCISSDYILNNSLNESKTNSTEKTSRKLQEIADNCIITYPKKNRESKRGIFPCEQCKRIFEYKSQLYRHKRLHSGERPYKCEVCEQSFKHNRNLKDHYSVCHTEDRPFPCRHKGCNKKFKTIRIRKLHEILHTNDLPFQCQDCGKCFPQNSYLITHRNTWHVDKSNYRHKCQFCEKTFYSKQNLKFHTYTHTGERPYGCPICPTKFTKPWSVKEHMKIHSGERKYICQVCSAAFNQIAGLIKHKKRHEEIVE